MIFRSPRVRIGLAAILGASVAWTSLFSLATATTAASVSPGHEASTSIPLRYARNSPTPTSSTTLPIGPGISYYLSLGDSVGMWDETGSFPYLLANRYSHSSVPGLRLVDMSYSGETTPTDLGPSLRVIPGPTDNEVWIWSDPCRGTAACTSPDNGYGQGEVRLVDLSGRQIGPAVALPVSVGPGESPRGSWFPTGLVVDGGLVLGNIYGADEEIWNPISNGVIRVPTGVDVIAAGGDLMATAAERACLPHCTIHLTNLQTGTERSIPIPTALTSTRLGTISPDGTLLALPIGMGGTWPGDHPTAVVVVDLRRGTARILLGTQESVMPNYGPVSVSWSSNGWLFAAVIGSTHVLVWRPGDQRAMVLPKAKLPGLDLGIPPQMQGSVPTLIAL